MTVGWIVKCDHPPDFNQVLDAAAQAIIKVVLPHDAGHAWVGQDVCVPRLLSFVAWERPMLLRATCTCEIIWKTQSLDEIPGHNISDPENGLCTLPCPCLPLLAWLEDLSSLWPSSMKALNIHGHGQKQRQGQSCLQLHGQSSQQAVTVCTVQ